MALSSLQKLIQFGALPQVSDTIGTCIGHYNTNYKLSLGINLFVNVLVCSYDR